MSITSTGLLSTLTAYLEIHPDETAQLADALQLLSAGGDFDSRQNFRMHVTVGALLVRGGTEVLLIDHLAYRIKLQPGGHLEPTDRSLIAAAMRELAEETGVDLAEISPVSRTPVHIEYGRVPARPEKGEPEHYHLDFAYAFETADAELGLLQEAEVTGAGWYPFPEAVALVGPRVLRAVDASATLG